MTSPARVVVSEWRGVGAVTLEAGALSATFLPGCGMLGASLQHDGDELFAHPRSLPEYRKGGATALPLLHPYANRLGAWRYEAVGRRVTLRKGSVPTDPNGLPIHGNAFGVPFDILDAGADNSTARLVTRFDYGAAPELLRAFPFPHDLVVDARLDGSRHALSITTEVRATQSGDVPVSFGWHPYLRLPGVPRSKWTLRWPRCEHVTLDKRLLPTGTRTELAPSSEPFGRRTFDDHYALGNDRMFWIEGGGRRITLTFDQSYPFAQLYAPPRRALCAIEPMTATVDALRHGDLPVVRAGDTFRATFRIEVGRAEEQ